MKTTAFSPNVAEAFRLGVSVTHRQDVDDRCIVVGDSDVDYAEVWALAESSFSDVLSTLDGLFTWMSDSLGMGQLSDTADVLAWSYEASIFCADHGAVLPEAHDELNPEGAYPVLSLSGYDLNAVEYCDHGHSFCGSCGFDMDTTRGSQDADVNGHFARCWNCSTESVYIDGEGFVSVYRWSDMFDTLTAEAYVSVPTAPFPPAFQDYAKLSAVVDESGTNVRTLCAFLAWIDDDPSAGTILIMVNGESFDDYGVDTADSAALDYFAEHADVDDYDSPEASDFRASVQLMRVPTDQVWFNTKP